MARRVGRRHAARLAAVALGAVVALAACSEESGGGGGSTTEGGSSVAAGAPVKLMMIAPTETASSNYPDMLGATRAAVRALNERGGIKGHPVELIYCNDKNDPETAKECAERAVDENVLAVVNAVSHVGGIMPILEQAGIPSVGSGGVSPDGLDLSSPISYVISPLTFYPAVCPSVLKAAGATRLGLVGYDLALSDRLVMMAQAGARAAGLPFAVEARVPITTSDFSPTAAQLRGAGVNGTALVVFDQGAYATITAGSQDELYCHALGVLSRDWLVQQGPAADRIVFASAFPELSQAAEFPELARAIKELDDAYAAGEADAAPELRTSSTNTIGAWLGVQVVERVGNAIPGDDLSAAALRAQLDQTTDLDLGLLPPLDFTRPNPIPGVERVFNHTLRAIRWDSATQTYVPLGNQTFDALELLAQGQGGA